MLLVCAGLMIRSLHNLWNVSPGFDPQGVVVFYTGLSPQHSDTPAKARGTLSTISTPDFAGCLGVEAASVDLGGLPFFGNTTVGFSREGDVRAPRDEMRMANIYGVTRDHFQAMGIRLVRGRSFTNQDTEKSRLVAVMDEDSALAVFPGRDPIGEYLHTALWDRPVEIVGIAGRVKQSRLDPDAATLQRDSSIFRSRKSRMAFLRWRPITV